MKKTSRELLALEHIDPSSLKDSALLVFGKNTKDEQIPCFDGKPVTAPLPSSQVLSKVKDFLGVFAEANKDLELKAKEKPEDYNIEALDGNESEYIEMDLMLGVADLHTPEAMTAAEAAIAGNQPVIDLHANDSSSESESSSDDDSDEDDELLKTGSSTGLEESDMHGDGQVRKQSNSNKKRKQANIVELP